MTRIAVLGGTGYLASIIKNQNNQKRNKFVFFSRKKKSKNYINYSSFENNFSLLKNFDYIIHLVGSNQKNLLQKRELIEKKNKITSDICNLCLKNNIKLIYISSLQIYQNYGVKNLYINSKINIKNPYSISHYQSEQIIKKKFKNNQNMFTILRIGNVFGYKKYENLKEIKNNLVHGLCFAALKNNKIIINNGSIQRSFIPSSIFIYVINLTIKKNIFKNSTINIFYKNYTLDEISKIIQKRFKLIYNDKVDIIIKKSNFNSKFIIFGDENYKLNSKINKINFEIDQILKNTKINDNNY